MRKFLVFGAAVAASTLALTSPAAAQWYPRDDGYGYDHNDDGDYRGSGRGDRYRHAIGPGARLDPDFAVDRCARSIARRGGRLIDVFQVGPTRVHTRVRGVARIGSRHGYGHAYRASSRFTCDVGYRGEVTNLTFDRRY
jgi:hypothetical protein